MSEPYKDWIVRFYANHNDIPEGHSDGGIVGELIRCKDCKHWDCDDSESYCDELGIFNTDMNSYCSYAKRKDNA